MAKPRGPVDPLMANLFCGADGIYYVRKMINGKRIKRSTGEIAHGRAQKRRDQILKELQNERWGWVRPATAPTFAEWWEHFQESYLPGYAVNSQIVYRGAVARVLPKLARKSLDEVTKSDCVKIVNGLKRHPYSAGTIQVTVACIHRVFQTAVDDEKLVKNPWRKIKTDAANVCIRVLTAEEERRLFAQLDPEHASWCRVLLGGGLRISELLGLRRRDIDFAGRLLSVVGKGNKRRDVPMTRFAGVVPDVEQELFAQCKGRSPNAVLWPLTRKTCGWQLRTRSKMAGIEKVTPHTLRHTFATRFVEAGGDIYLLSRILGHASVDITTRIYVHESKQSLVAGLDRAFSPVPKIGPASVLPELLGNNSGQILQLSDNGSLCQRPRKKLR